MSESTLYFSKELNLGEQPIGKILLTFWDGQYNTKIHLSILIWIMVICAAYNLHVKCDDDQNLSYCFVETSSFSIEKWYLRSLLMCLNYQWPANQSSYLPRISRIIFMEKKLSCGEISAFYTEFEQFMEFYRSLCRFCSKSMWRKICAEKISVEKTWQIWGLAQKRLKCKINTIFHLVWDIPCSYPARLSFSFIQYIQYLCIDHDRLISQSRQKRNLVQLFTRVSCLS